MRKISRALFFIGFILFSVLLVGCFNKNETLKEFKVSFNTNGGSMVLDQLVKKGEKAIRPNQNPTHDDYEFIDWYDSLNYDILYDFNLPVNNDLTIYAKWDDEVIDESVINISFNTNGALKIAALVAEPGSKITAPKVKVEKDGYIFKGWKYKDKPYIFNLMPDESIVLEADYQKIDEFYNKVHTLPKLFINIEDNLALKEVVKEEYVNSTVTIANSDYDVQALSAEIKGRGNGSWTGSGPKRGYRLKFFNKESMFGEAASKHWVLLAGANFYDVSMLKMRTVFGMSKLHFSNIEYTSSTNWVELYVNGEYRGVYVFAEHQRVDKNRVNIKSEYGVIDTGYLIEYDSYAKEEGEEDLYWFKVPGYKYGITIKSPDVDDYLDEGLTTEQFKAQIAFIKDYTTQVLKAALDAPNSLDAYNTFTLLADVDSFVDMYILHELFKNADTGWSSFYMKKKAGGKLYADAPWDFDASMGANRGSSFDKSPYGIYVGDSVQNESKITVSELYISLMKVDKFVLLVSKRWKELSSDLEAYVKDFLTDDYFETTKEAIGKNLLFWSDHRDYEGHYATGASAYAVYYSLESAEQGYVNSAKEIRTWILTRIDWLNNYLA